MLFTTYTNVSALLLRELVHTYRRIPHRTLYPRAKLSCKGTDVLRLLGRIQYVRQMAELNTQHRICGGKES